MNKGLETYITQNYNELLNQSKKITKHSEMAGDLLHSVIIQFYDAKKEIKITDCPNSYRNYITHCLQMNWHSKTSRFYYQYKKPISFMVELNDYVEYQQPEDDFELREQLFILIEESYTELDWFYRTLMEMYIITKSMKAISRQTKIPETNIHRYIKDAKQQIVEKVNSRLYD